MGVAVLVFIVRIEFEHLVKFCWACAWLMSSLMSHMVGSSESAPSNFTFFAALTEDAGAGCGAGGGQAMAGGGGGGASCGGGGQALAGGGAGGASFEAGGQALAGGGGGGAFFGGGGGRKALALCCWLSMNISLSHLNFSIEKTKRPSARDEW